MLGTFPRGIHPGGYKELSKDSLIEIMPAPKRVYIPLLQHAGKPATALVKVGQEVKKGQCIAQLPDLSGRIFASVTGKVIAIEDRPTPTGNCQHAVIERSDKDESEKLTPLADPSPQEIFDRVKEAGIAGMGGAGFPTCAKLQPHGAIEQLIINGAECEPYVTCDYRIMLEYAEKLVGGVLLLKKALNAASAVIGIEDNKPDAIKHLTGYVTANNLPVTIAAVKTKYPQGSDKQLIYSLTGKKIPKGKRSSAYGVAVFNVHTALSVYLAVKEGQPCYARVMTVTGGGIKEPKNLWVPNGSLFADIIAYCGGIREDNPPVKLIDGGPMMGKTVATDGYAATKTSGCLLLLTRSEASTAPPAACINCGRCARVCPMNLMPMFIESYALAGDLAGAEKYGANFCLECGCCSYVCPAKRQLVQSIKIAKSKLKARDKSNG